MKDLTIILPTLNEEGNIINTIRDLRTISKEMTIIVVDDGSKDQTQTFVHQEIQRDNNLVLIDRSNAPVKGLSASAWEGIRRAETKYVLVMDADGQHPIKIIPIMYSKRIYSLVIASRKELPKEWPLKRRIISKTATFLANLSLARKYKDPMSGMFMAQTKMLQVMYIMRAERLELKGYKILFDILKNTHFHSLVQEVYYTEFKTRKHGESKLGKRQIISFLKQLIR